MQQNEEKNVVEDKLQFANDEAQFHTPKRVQYTMQRIPRIEEQPIRYRMPSIAIMEPQNHSLVEQ